MKAILLRLVSEQRAEGTSSGAIRIAVWVVVALAVLGIVGPKIYSAATNAGSCLTAAGGASTSGYQTAGAVPGC